MDEATQWQKGQRVLVPAAAIVWGEDYSPPYIQGGVVLDDQPFQTSSYSVNFSDRVNTALRDSIPVCLDGGNYDGVHRTWVYPDKLVPLWRDDLVVAWLLGQD